MAVDENCSTPVPAPVATPAASGVPPAISPADGPANPAALTIGQLAKMLAVPLGKVREHVAAGAPVAADGTINLVNYAAWLNRRLKELDGD